MERVPNGDDSQAHMVPSFGKVKTGKPRAPKLQVCSLLVQAYRTLLNVSSCPLKGFRVEGPRNPTVPKQDKEAVKRKRAYASLDDEDAARTPNQARPARPPAQARPGPAHAAAPGSGGPPRTMLRLRFSAVIVPCPPPAESTYNIMRGHAKSLRKCLRSAGFLLVGPCDAQVSVLVWPRSAVRTCLVNVLANHDMRRMMVWWTLQDWCLVQDYALPTETQVHVALKRLDPLLKKEAVQVNTKKRVVIAKFGDEPRATQASMALDRWSDFWHHPKASI